MMGSGNSTGNNLFSSGILQDLAQYFPPYLRENRQAAFGLKEELEKFPDNMSYYSSHHRGEWLQGDGYQRFEIYSFERNETKETKGIILSNSCDILTENKRAFPVNVIFAPIIPLLGIQNILQQAQKNSESTINAIKSQQMTSMFFLPAQAESALQEDYVVMFDKTSHIPRNYFKEHAGQQLFTLSQAGFYLFTMKLSIHFCRLHENILRGTP